MKKKMMFRKTLAWALATIMLVGESSMAYAAETEPTDPIVVEAPTEDVSGGDETVVEDPTAEEPSTEEPGSENPADVSGGDVTDVEIPAVEEIAEMFPGLDDSYAMSTEEIQAKQEVLDYSYDWANIDEQDNYAPNEVMFLADTEEEALAYAHAYNGNLISYSYRVAVITLNANPAFENATVGDAMRAAANMDSNLPAVWPNYVRYLDDTEEFENSYSVTPETTDAVVEAADEAADEELGDEETEVGNETEADPYMGVTSSYYEWYHSVVNSEIAYNANYRGKGVKVAIIDAGARTNHEDLTGGITEYRVNDKLSWTTGYNGNHGANVAGIVGARANTVGGRGIAPECSLMTIRIAESDGTMEDNYIIQAIALAKEKGASVINMSLGGAGYNGAFNTAVTEAYKAGIAVFCSAGNNYAESIHYPAGYDKAFGVSALNYSLNKTDFSNFGKTVNFCAPGYNMWAPFNTTDANSPCVQRVSGNDTTWYGRMSGTSQATPVISGCAAVLLGSGQVSGKGSTRVDNLIRLMNKGCVKANGSGLGNGYVDLAKALGLSNKVQAPNKPVFGLKAGTYNSSGVSITIKAESGCTIYYSTDGKAVTYKNGVLSANANTYSGSFTVSGAASVTVNAIAVKNSNGLASANVSARYTLKPLVSSLSVSSKTGATSLARGTTLPMQAVVTPNYAANKKVTWSVSPAGSGVTINASGVVTASKDATLTKYIVTAKAADGSGKSATASISVVAAPSNPVTGITAKTKNVTILKGKTYSVSDSVLTINYSNKTSATTPGSLTWVSDNKSVATVNSTGTITAVDVGKAKITGAAKDGSGKTIVYSVTVTQPVVGLTISGPTKVAQGKSITLTTSTTAKAANGKLDWSISPNNGKVTVAGGKVTAKADAPTGNYTITAKATDGSGMSKSYTVTVVLASAQAAELSTSTKALSIFRVTGGTSAKTSASFTVTCKTAGKTTSTNWSATSSNPGIATVSVSGTTVTVSATGKAAGSTTITIATTDGSNKKATVKVTVKNPATKLLIAPTGGRSDYVAKGATLKMGVYLVTENGKIEADAKKFTWTSSNSALKVDANGTVTGMSINRTTATITAKATDGSGLSATYVLASCDKTKNIYMGNYSSGGRLGAKKGKSYSLTVNQIAADKKGSCGKGYSIKSSGTGLEAGIKYNSSTGYYQVLLICNKAGSYTVTLSANDGSNTKKTYTIVVR